MGKAYPLHTIKFTKDAAIMVILKNGTIWYPSESEIEALKDFKKKREEFLFQKLKTCKCRE